MVKEFQHWLTHHKSFPKEFEEFLLRDILHYTTEDLKELSLRERTFALTYCINTYARRDVSLNLGKLLKKGKGNTGRGDFTIEFEHPEIENYIKESYKKKLKEVREHTKV